MPFEAKFLNLSTDNYSIDLIDPSNQKVIQTIELKETENKKMKCPFERLNIILKNLTNTKEHLIFDLPECELYTIDKDFSKNVTIIKNDRKGKKFEGTTNQKHKLSINTNIDSKQPSLTINTNIDSKRSSNLKSSSSKNLVQINLKENSNLNTDMFVVPNTNLNNINYSVNNNPHKLEIVNDVKKDKKETKTRFNDVPLETKYYYTPKTTTNLNAEKISYDLNNNNNKYLGNLFKNEKSNHETISYDTNYFSSKSYVAPDTFKNEYSGIDNTFVSKENYLSLDNYTKFVTPINSSSSNINNNNHSSNYYNSANNYSSRTHESIKRKTSNFGYELPLKTDNNSDPIKSNIVSNNPSASLETNFKLGTQDGKKYINEINYPSTVSDSTLNSKYYYSSGSQPISTNYYSASNTNDFHSTTPYSIQTSSGNKKTDLNYIPSDQPKLIYLNNYFVESNNSENKSKNFYIHEINNILEKYNIPSTNTYTSNYSNTTYPTTNIISTREQNNDEKKNIVTGSTTNNNTLTNNCNLNINASSSGDNLSLGTNKNDYYFNYDNTNPIIDQTYTSKIEKIYVSQHEYFKNKYKYINSTYNYKPETPTPSITNTTITNIPSSSNIKNNLTPLDGDTNSSVNPSTNDKTTTINQINFYTVTAHNTTTTANTSDDKTTSANTTNYKALIANTNNDKATIANTTNYKASTANSTDEKTTLANSTNDTTPLSNSTKDKTTLVNITNDKIPTNKISALANPTNNTSTLGNLTIDRTTLANTTNDSPLVNTINDKTPSINATNNITTDQKTNDKTSTFNTTDDKTTKTDATKYYTDDKTNTFNPTNYNTTSYNTNTTFNPTYYYIPTNDTASTYNPTNQYTTTYNSTTTFNALNYYTTTNETTNNIKKDETLTNDYANKNVIELEHTANNYPNTIIDFNVDDYVKNILKDYSTPSDAFIQKKEVIVEPSLNQQIIFDKKINEENKQNQGQTSENNMKISTFNNECQNKNDILNVKNETQNKDVNNQKSPLHLLKNVDISNIEHKPEHKSRIAESEIIETVIVNQIESPENLVKKSSLEVNRYVVSEDLTEKKSLDSKENILVNLKNPFSDELKKHLMAKTEDNHGNFNHFLLDNKISNNIESKLVYPENIYVNNTYFYGDMNIGKKQNDFKPELVNPEVVNPEFFQGGLEYW